MRYLLIRILAYLLIVTGCEMGLCLFVPLSSDNFLILAGTLTATLTIVDRLLAQAPATPDVVEFFEGIEQ